MTAPRYAPPPVKQAGISKVSPIFTPVVTQPNTPDIHRPRTQDDPCYISALEKALADKNHPAPYGLSTKYPNVLQYGPLKQRFELSRILGARFRAFAATPEALKDILQCLEYLSSSPSSTPHLVYQLALTTEVVDRMIKYNIVV